MNALKKKEKIQLILNWYPCQGQIVDSLSLRKRLEK